MKFTTQPIAVFVLGDHGNERPCACKFLTFILAGGSIQHSHSRHSIQNNHILVVIFIALISLKHSDTCQSARDELVDDKANRAFSKYLRR